jgi:hypothetical protein
MSVPYSVETLGSIPVAKVYTEVSLAMVKEAPGRSV